MKTFNAIIYTGDKQIGNQGYVKYRKITGLNRFLTFVAKKYPQWVFFNLYDKATNQKWCIKKGQPLPASLAV